MPSSSRIPLRPLFAALAVGSLLLAGCNVGTGGGGSPSPNATTPAATATTDTGGGGYYGGGGGATDYPTGTPAATDAASPGATTYTIDVAQSAALGAYLTGKGGMTLYSNSYTDSSTSSACNGSCAQNWPPYLLKAGQTAGGGAGVTGTFGTITRADGTTQLTYAGLPLYYYSGDNAAGDTSGNGLQNGYWQVATP